MRPYDNKKVLIFLGGNNFLEGLFDTNNIKFIRNFFDLKLSNFSHVLMTIITPRRLSSEQQKVLSAREEQLKKIAYSNMATIDFCHIYGRTPQSIINASKEIAKKTKFFQKRYIWAQNYFNCILGVLLKNKLPDTYLHFELLGLVPEEELFYSESTPMSRVIKFIVLRIIGRIDLYFSDSISVVSNQFKRYIISKYRLASVSIDVTPCLYDEKMFFNDPEARVRFRRKYDISDQQKLILYSGMLQKWQKPDMLFAFIKQLQKQDVNHELRFILMTYDQKRARQYRSKYTIKDLIIDSGIGDKLNGVYNAADIGIACRSSDMVSKVSSPVKIPEYLATCNSIILLESNGDFGIGLKTKNYALVKKNYKDFLNTSIREVNGLKKPNDADLNNIYDQYCLQGNLSVLKKIFAKQK